MTEVQLRQKIVDTAKKHLGAAEGTAAHKAIIDTYNKITPLPRGYKVSYTDAWCATYVSAMFYEAGMVNLIHPECSCFYMLEGMKKLGSWVENDAYVPKMGDIIFYDWEDDGVGDNKGGADHVGIVASCNGKNIKVIEGNRKDSVCYRDMKVDGKYIRGYATPNFGLIATPVKFVSVSMATLCRGDADNAKSGPVRTLQRLLRQLEYVGSNGKLLAVDGKFGSDTEAAVKRYQKNRGAKKPDGVVGEWTWTKLLKG